MTNLKGATGMIHLYLVLRSLGEGGFPRKFFRTNIFR